MQNRPMMTWLIALVLSACSSSGFEGSKKDQDKAATGTSDQTSGEEDASAPISTAGAFLLCSRVDDLVGCRIEDSLAQKVDETRYPIAWGYVNKDKSQQGLAMEKLDKSHRYHVRFSLQRGYWSDYFLGVTVNGGKDATLQALRNMAHVDGRRTSLINVKSDGPPTLVPRVAEQFSDELPSNGSMPGNNGNSSFLSMLNQFLQSLANQNQSTSGH